MEIQKKLFFILYLMLIITSIFSACEKKEKKEISIDNYYKTEQLQINNVPEQVDLIREFSDTIWLSGKREKKSCLGSFTISELDYQETIIDLPENEQIIDFYINNEGIIMIITSETQTKQEKYLKKLRLYQYSKNSEIKMLSELKTCNNIYHICITEDNIYLVEEGIYIYVFNKKGKQKSTSKSSKRIEAICGNEQKCSYIAVDSISKNMIIGDINATGKTVEKGQIKMQIGEDIHIFLSKDTNDEMYYIDRSGIYKIKKEKKAFETVLTWDYLHIIRNNIISLISLKNNEFLCWNAKEQYFQQIKEKKKKEKKEEENAVETIVFASQKIQDIDRELIYRFNKEHKDCNIIIRDYSDKREQFHLDIASGDIPDIINFDSEDPINLIEKGIFTDLSVFMETDPDVSKKDFHDRLIELLEVDQEKIYFLPPDFNIVALAGSKKDIGERESWTLKEFETFCKEKKAEGKQIFPILNGASFVVLNSRYTMKDYVNLNTKTVNFLTEDFKRMLSIAKDYFEMDINANQSSLKSIKDGDVALMNINGLLAFSQCLQYQWAFGKEEYSFIGYPSKDNSQSGIGIDIDQYYGIAESCNRKEEAWEFLRQYFLKDSKPSGNSSGFPVRKDVMEYREECAMAKKTYINKKGEKVIPIINGQLDIGDGIMIKKRPLKRKQIKQVEELINKADMLNINTSIYAQISIIIGNEVYAGFNDNKSIEEIMDIIQNRISIMINEQK